MWWFLSLLVPWRLVAAATVATALLMLLGVDVLGITWTMAKPVIDGFLAWAESTVTDWLNPL